MHLSIGLNKQEMLFIVVVVVIVIFNFLWGFKLGGAQGLILRQSSEIIPAIAQGTI